ncbi:hypothetical protein SSTU70S_04744 [Stutzerimonas stutzeri]
MPQFGRRHPAVRVELGLTDSHVSDLLGTLPLQLKPAGGEGPRAIREHRSGTPAVRISDDQAILLSDIFPTGYFGAEMAEIRPGYTVAVFGCCLVGLFAIVSARLLGAGRVFAIDQYPDRLRAAQRQGAEIIDFNREDPIATLQRLTGGIGVDRAIDAVGIDAEHGCCGEQPTGHAPAPNNNAQWQPGDAPSQALEWAVQALAKAGTLSIIGVYSPEAMRFPSARR